MKYAIDVKNSKIEDLHRFVETYLPPKEFEKNMFGEVFTPLSLVTEMLDAVEKYSGVKDFWSNPNLKILDPAAGIGNFPLVAYQKLMKGLAKVKGFEKEEKRRKHILENMLYMVELNPVNTKLISKIFNGKSYNLNFLTTSFLLESEKDIQNESGSLSSKQKRDGKELLKWKKTLKFDLVMGNPPFQKPIHEKRKLGFVGATLWDEFVKQSLKLIKPEGYMTLIHPSGWRKPEHEMWDVITANQILYLNINSMKQGLTLFGAGTRFNWYVLKRTKPTKTTTICDEENKTWKLDIKKWSFLPNGEYRLIAKLFDWTRKTTFDVIYSSSKYETRQPYISKTKEDVFTYPIIHMLNKDGIGYVYSNTNEKGHFGIPKVILTFGRHQYPVNDYKGQYGMSQIIFGLPISSKTEGEKIIKGINSEKFKQIMLMTKWSTFQTEWRMFNYLRRDFYKFLE
jgi:hypothetical protein